MKDLLGVIYFAVILVIARYVVVVTAWITTRNGFIIFMAAIFVAMLGFMFITDRGFSKTPRPPKYHGQD